MHLDPLYLYMYTYTHMNSTIYIRKENEEKWKAIEDKSQWVNERLGTAPSGTVGKATEIEVDTFRRANDLLMSAPVPQAGRYVATPQGTFGPTPEPSKPRPSCKIHGIPLDSRGRCLQKGCKYS